MLTSCCAIGSIYKHDGTRPLPAGWEVSTDSHDISHDLRILKFGTPCQKTQFSNGIQGAVSLDPYNKAPADLCVST